MVNNMKNISAEVSRREKGKNFGNLRIFGYRPESFQFSVENSSFRILRITFVLILPYKHGPERAGASSRDKICHR